VLHQTKAVRIFFASDIHGSDVCFRKFLNAASFYQCSVIIMGGDLTGKMLVPIIESEPGQYVADVAGVKHTATTGDIDILVKLIGNAGYYPLVVSKEQMQDLRSNPTLLNKTFGRLIKEKLYSWMELARTKLSELEYSA